MSEASVPPFKSHPLPPDDDTRAFLYNQERIITQQDALLEVQKRLVDAMEKVASPERVRGVESGMDRMVAAVNELSVKMDAANDELGAAVSKLASAFWGMMKVPVAVIVVGVASWAYLHVGKISEHTWLIMLGVAVFPWLGDSVTAIARLFGIGRKDENETTKHH